MKRRLLISALTILLAQSASPTAQSEDQPRPAIESVSWLSGSWILVDGKRTVREYWLPPVNGAIAGITATTVGTKPPKFEFMKISSPNGKLVFTALVDDQAPTHFAQKSGQNGEIVFENLAHDFPQRVIYRQCENDLCGRIEGVENGKSQAFDWRYARTTNAAFPK